MKEIALVVLGFILSFIPSWLNRRRRLKTHWHAIRAEMTLCEEKAQTFRRDSIRAPLYRLPIVAFNTSFPILLADGAVTEEEILCIGRFYSQVQDMNRGLDRAAEMETLGNDSNLSNSTDLVIESITKSHSRQAEYNRNLLKAQTLIVGRNGQESLYAPAKKIVDKKISLRWWEY